MENTYIYLMIFAGVSFCVFYFFNDKKSSEIIPYNKNDGSAKASGVMTAMFETLLKEDSGWLKIYAKDLNGEISGLDRYIGQLIKLIEANQYDIQIIIDKKPTKIKNKSNAYDLLKSYETEDNFKFRLVNLDERGGSNQSLQSNLKSIFKKFQLGKESEFEEGHFAISSLNSFRFEYSQIKHMALFSIGPKEKNQYLIRKTKELIPKLKSCFDTTLEKYN